MKTYIERITDFLVEQNLITKSYARHMNNIVLDNFIPVEYTRLREGFWLGQSLYHGVVTPGMAYDFFLLIGWGMDSFGMRPILEGLLDPDLSWES